MKLATRDDSVFTSETIGPPGGCERLIHFSNGLCILRRM